MIWGYNYFRKHPYQNIRISLWKYSLECCVRTYLPFAIKGKTPHHPSCCELRIASCSLLEKFMFGGCLADCSITIYYWYWWFSTHSDVLGGSMAGKMAYHWLVNGVYENGNPLTSHLKKAAIPTFSFDKKSSPKFFQILTMLELLRMIPNV